MDIQRLFLKADGRIGRGEFWTGFLILFVLGIVVHFVPVIGQIAAIVLIYPWVCLFSKRLHDMGKSGWLQLIPIAVWIVAVMVAVMSGMGGAIMSMASGSDAQATASALAGAGIAALVLAAACLINLVFLLWVGLSPSQAGDNAYGPPPGTAATTAAA
jgi:uncharacterized membrane protein YhaH (DUF805 family)